MYGFVQIVNEKVRGVLSDTFSAAHKQPPAPETTSFSARSLHDLFFSQRIVPIDHLKPSFILSGARTIGQILSQNTHTKESKHERFRIAFRELAGTLENWKGGDAVPIENAIIRLLNKNVQCLPAAIDHLVQKQQLLNEVYTAPAAFTTLSHLNTLTSGELQKQINSLSYFNGRIGGLFAQAGITCDSREKTKDHLLTHKHWHL